MQSDANADVNTDTNVDDRGDYNSSTVLHTDELKMVLAAPC